MSRVITADAFDALADLEAESVHAIVKPVVLWARNVMGNYGRTVIPGPGMAT